MKHEIEIPDLPEGYEAIAFRPFKANEEILLGRQVVSWLHKDLSGGSHLIVRKKQPRRIVLEEVEAGYGKVEFFHDRRYWKIVEDNKCAE